MLSSFIVFVIALAALVVSGRLIIRSLTALATAFGISEFVAAFILLAIATSTPELFVAVSSSLQGAGDLVIGTALGSNVINMTFVVGLAAVLSAGIATVGLSLRRDILIGGAITVLPIILLYDGRLSRVDGLLLLLVFSLYIFRLIRDEHIFSVSRMPHHIGKGLGHLIIVAVLFVTLVYAARYTVSSAVDIAAAVRIPQFAIGLFLLAFGTSLPELAATIQAALLRKPGFALGTIIGSSVANSSLIIGVGSVIKPITLSLTPPVIVTALAVAISLFLLGWFSLSSQKLSIKEGFYLILFFFLFGGIIMLLSVAPATAS